MSITIPPELSEFVRDAVASGRYRSKHEVLSSALKLLRERELKWRALREDVQAGIAELDRGESALLDIEEINTSAREHRAQRQRRK